jgi:hypothetical protein
MGPPGKEQVRAVVETRDGNLDRLQSLNGQPITPEQARLEDQRIERLLHKPDEQKKQKRAQEEDARLAARFFAILPQAVKSAYGEQHPGLVEIVFKPNPDYHPTSHEASVIHEMVGRVTIDCREERLVEIEARLVDSVKFGGGLLGHLQKGGEFHVRQSEVAPNHWEITLLHVNMHGKALLFKTITVQEDETRTDFRRAPDIWTLAQAAAELQKKSTDKSLSADAR